MPEFEQKDRIQEYKDAYVKHYLEWLKKLEKFKQAKAEYEMAKQKVDDMEAELRSFYPSDQSGGKSHFQDLEALRKKAIGMHYKTEQAEQDS